MARLASYVELTSRLLSRHSHRLSTAFVFGLGGFAAAAFGVAPLLPDPADLPQRLVVYAVEGADSDFGTGLSPAVAAAVPELVAAVESEITDAGRGAARRRPS